MGKAAVLFQSKYGATRRYAEEIARRLDGDLFENTGKVSLDLGAYDVVVIGGGIYADSVSGISWVSKNEAALEGKELVVFACGLSDPADAQTHQKLRERLRDQLPASLRDRTAFFQLRGGMAYKKLRFLHKRMMDMISGALQKKGDGDMTEEERVFCRVSREEVDYVDLVSVAPLVDWVKTRRERRA